MEATPEILAQVLTKFAQAICERQGIKFINGSYSIIVEEEMLPDMIIESGNPVLIKINARVLAEGIINHKRLPELKQVMQRALEISAKRMLHTLSQNPIAPAIVKDNLKDRSWTKVKSSKAYFPNLLPIDEVVFSTYIIVTAMHVKTDQIIWTEKGYAHKTSIGELERKAWIGLSNEILNPKVENEE